MEIVTKQYVLDRLFEKQKHDSEANNLRHERIINSKQKIINVATCDVRKVAKDVLKNDFAEYLNKAKVTDVYDEFFEETVVQGLVIAGLKNIDEQVENLKWWVLKIDNWATCDTVASTFKKMKKLKEKDKYFNYFYNLCFDCNEFVARFGIIMLLANFLEEKYIDKILAMCESVTSEAYYVQMAISWLLSFAFMKFKDKTYNLFKKKTLPKFVQNKAISKCRDSFQVDDFDKKNLINFRK